MDTARWLIKARGERMKFFFGSSCYYFYQTNFWDYEIPVDDHLFCGPIAVLQDIILKYWIGFLNFIYMVIQIAEN